MKRKALYVVAVLAGALGVATVALRPRVETRPTAPPTGASPAKPAMAASPEARLSEDPVLARAMKCWRVHEDLNQSVYSARSYAYEAEVSPDGLKFRAAERTLSFGAPTVTQGDRSIECSGGTTSRAAFGHAVVDRAIMTEEYLFENNRVEQLFRIPRPIGGGTLTVRIPVQTEVGGRVTPLPSASEGKLRSAALRFTSADEKTSFLYHSAVVIDARGEKLALIPRYEDGAIALAVPGEFLAKAQYPVVVDPYVELDFSGSGPGFSITTGFSDAPAVAIEGGGNPYVAWSERVPLGAKPNFEIFFRYWNGLAWTSLAGSDQNRGISDNDGDSTNPSVAIEGDGLGHPAVAWQDDSSGNFDIYLRVWDGTTWKGLENDTDIGGTSATPDGGLSHTSGESRNPSVTFVQALRPYATSLQSLEVPAVVWEDTSFGFPEIFGRVWYPGDPGHPGDAALGLLLVDSIKPAWYQIQDSAGNLFRSISANPAGTAERPRIIRDPQNRLLVTWQGTANASLPSSTYETMFARFTIDPILHNSGFGPINPNGEFYPDPGNTTGVFGLLQMKGTWAGVNGVTRTDNVSNTGGPSPAGRSINPAITVCRSNGDIYIAWEESLSATNTEIYVARSALGSGAWGSSGTGPTSGTSNGGTGISDTPTPSRTPAISVDGTNAPVVCWVDDQPGNFEIYLRQLTAGAWSELGFMAHSASPDLVALGLGGISNTFNSSLYPAVRVGNGGLPTIVWADWVSGTGPFGSSTFDIYCKRFYSNEPRRLRVYSTDPLLPANTLVPSGGFTNQLSVDLRCWIFSEPTNVQLWMEVEVKPITAPFVGTFTAQSLLIPVNPGTHLSDPLEASVIFTGLTNTAYHVRFRTKDQVGRQSAWFSYGGNADGLADFVVGAPAPGSPAPPSNLQALLVPGGVQLDWNSAPAATSYNVYRGASTGFIPSAANQIASGVGGLTFIDSGVLPSTTYFYLVTGVNVAGESSPSNEATITTGPVGGPGPGPGPGPGGAGNDEDEACGLLGVEFVLGMAALALFRRRRK